MKQGLLNAFLLYVISFLVILGLTSALAKHPTKQDIQTQDSKRYSNIDTFVNSSRIVVLDYWFIGCAWCKKSIPAMNDVAKIYSAKGVRFYGLNPMDDFTKIADYKQKNLVSYPMFPITNELAKKSFINEYPTVVIYKDKKVAMTLEGFSELTHQQISDLLDKLLKP